MRVKRKLQGGTQGCEQKKKKKNYVNIGKTFGATITKDNA